MIAKLSRRNTLTTALFWTTKKFTENLTTKICTFKQLYIQAIIDYISGMTDHFAIDIFNEMITY
ncbi:hypothetical protein [Ruminococcus sp.]|uniref:hypothetical protein n=1 Tax=Ruminococcus sp. TaxID=41978 RepID=UPI00352261A6